MTITKAPDTALDGTLRTLLSTHMPVTNPPLVISSGYGTQDITYPIGLIENITTTPIEKTFEDDAKVLGILFQVRFISLKRADAQWFRWQSHDIMSAAFKNKTLILSGGWTLIDLRLTGAIPTTSSPDTAGRVLTQCGFEYEAKIQKE